MANRWIAAAAIWVAIAIAVIVLARGLPAETFYTGDPGVKLVASRNAIATPSRPLEIPLPTVRGRDLPYLDPFYAVHGDHAHAVTSELFPLASAPFIAAMGARGAYVLPALGFLLAIAGAAWLGVLLDTQRSPAAIMLTALLGTPLLFYGLEFWEHAPAAGISALAMCLLVRSSSRPGTGRRPLADFEATTAGVLFGVAFLLRPETVCIAIAVLVAARWLLGASVRQAGLTIAGMAIAVLPLAAYALLHFGHVLTPHFAGNPALWDAGWLGRRGAILSEWLVSIGPSNVFIVAPVVLVALALPWQGERRQGQGFLVAVASLAAVLIFLSAPNDGGGQWGPRYLLPVAVPLTVLAADVLQAVTARWRAGVWITVALSLGGAWVQRTSYERLRGTKQTYQRVLSLVETTAPPGSYVVTDLWWLDQIAAALDNRVFLYAPDAATGSAIVRELDTAGIEDVALIASGDESGDQTSWLEGTCYVSRERQEITERSLTGTRLDRRCD